MISPRKYKITGLGSPAEPGYVSSRVGRLLSPRCAGKRFIGFPIPGPHAPDLRGSVYSSKIRGKAEARPLNEGGRFSKNAATPSLPSPIEV
jgi:hypothetical protein